jgi:hypothetical protein
VSASHARAVHGTRPGYAARIENCPKNWLATFDRIASIPTILTGQPTIRGMRRTVRRVI